METFLVPWQKSAEHPVSANVFVLIGRERPSIKTPEQHSCLSLTNALTLEFIFWNWYVSKTVPESLSNSCDYFCFSWPMILQIWTLRKNFQDWITHIDSLIDANLYSFITLSTPHLGYLYEPSTHIQAGLWVMKNLQKSNSLDEICMRDGQ